MLGIAILLGFNLLGYSLQYVGVPLPGNVIGMILLTASLFAGWVKLAWIERTAQLLLDHLMLFFAPVIVGTIVFFNEIGSQIVPIVVSLVASTVAVLLVTGWTVQLTDRRQTKS